MVESPLLSDDFFSHHCCSRISAPDRKFSAGEIPTPASLPHMFRTHRRSRGNEPFLTYPCLLSLYHSPFSSLSIPKSSFQSRRCSGICVLCSAVNISLWCNTRNASLAPAYPKEGFSSDNETFTLMASSISLNLVCFRVTHHVVCEDGCPRTERLDLLRNQVIVITYGESSERRSSAVGGSLQLPKTVSNQNRRQVALHLLSATPL